LLESIRRTTRLGAAVLALSLSQVPPAATATGLPEYTIRKAVGPIAIDGLLDESSWSAAATVGDFLFPWYQDGDKEQTEARLLWDDENLYVSFIARDKHISAVLTKRDDPVSRDDAVEVFIAPDSADVSQYFNFEFNALGTILDRSPHDSRSSSWNGDVAVAIRIDGTLNEEADQDSVWVTELAIPFETFAGFAPALPPVPGDTWRLNLYRIGGAVNPQFSVWSDTRTERPKYHVPERFGIVHFSAVGVGVDEPTAVEDTSLGTLKLERE
jgi:hypothetical protein